MLRNFHGGKRKQEGQGPQQERQTHKLQTVLHGRDRDGWVLFVLILVNFFSCQFGHGSNIGVAVSLPGRGPRLRKASIMQSYMMFHSQCLDGFEGL